MMGAAVLAVDSDGEVAQAGHGAGQVHRSPPEMRSTLAALKTGRKDVWTSRVSAVEPSRRFSRQMEPLGHRA